jgi:hypothetical protein
MATRCWPGGRVVVALDANNPGGGRSHRVGHRRLVAEHEFDTLPLGHRQRRNVLFQTTLLIDRT